MERGYIKIGDNRIEFPKGLQVLDRSVILDMVNLDEVDLKKKNEYINENLIEVYLPDTLVVISDFTFKNCKNLIRVILPISNSLRYIEKATFKGCDSLAFFDFAFCSDLRLIGDEAFKNTNATALQYGDKGSDIRLAIDDEGYFISENAIKMTEEIEDIENETDIDNLEDDTITSDIDENVEENINETVESGVDEEIEKENELADTENIDVIDIPDSEDTEVSKELLDTEDDIDIFDNISETPKRSRGRGKQEVPEIPII